MNSVSEQIFTNCTNQGPIFVHVKDGKIVRIRPIVFDENDGASWTIVANGNKFSPPRKATLAPSVFTERQKVYSEDRLKYPMKREDWDPKGDRNPQNRGKSKYVRTSWDEALDIVTSEMKRLRSAYGPAAIAAHALACYPKMRRVWHPTRVLSKLKNGSNNLYLINCRYELFTRRTYNDSKCVDGRLLPTSYNA